MPVARKKYVMVAPQGTAGSEEVRATEDDQVVEEDEGEPDEDAASDGAVAAAGGGAEERGAQLLAEVRHLREVGHAQVTLQWLQSRQHRGEVAPPIGHGAEQRLGLAEIQHAI